MRIRNDDPPARAKSQAANAVRRLPRWSGAVGLGAKRPSGIAAWSHASSMDR